MKTKYFVLLLSNLLFVFESFSIDLINPPDSIRVDTLFTLSKFDVNQIYQKDMTLDKIIEFDKAYYKDYFIDENTTTIANRFDYGGRYYGGIQIHKFPSGIKHNVDFPERHPIANPVFHTGSNQIYNDSQFTAHLKIRLGNINPAKHPFLKIKYRPIGNRSDYAGSYEDGTCHCWAGINNLNIQAYWGYLMVSNNSISNIPKVTNNDSLGNFFRISPLTDKAQFPIYIDKSRSDFIFSQRVETIIDNQTHLPIKYIYDTIIPLWNKVDLTNFEIIIRGCAIQLLDDVLIYSIDTINSSGINKIEMEVPEYYIFNGKIFFKHFKSNSIYKLSIYSIDGVNINEYLNFKPEIGNSMDLNLQNGIYFSILSDDEGNNYTKRFIVN